MKILTINCVNNIYSTGKLIAGIEYYTVYKGCEYMHCYEMGERPQNEHEYRISNNLEYRLAYLNAKISGMQYGSGTRVTKRLCKKIDQYGPDIVHIHCPNAKSVNLYYLLNYLKKGRYHTIITNHAEFFYTGNCAYAFEMDCSGYLEGCIHCRMFRSCTGSFIFNRTAESWKRMKKAFEKFDDLTMVAVSPWVEKRSRTSVIAGGIPVTVIKNGIDTEKIFYYQLNEILKNRYKKYKVLLHVTSNFSDRPDDQKGGRYILQLAARRKDLKVIVIGHCENIRMNIPGNIEMTGLIRDQRLLAQYYSIADLTVITSKSETYGLTCAESLCCGTPVVGFHNGGTGTIALPEYSSFVEYGDIEGLVSLIDQWIDKKRYFQKELELIAGEEYTDRKMAMEYYKLYRQVLGKTS